MVDSASATLLHGGLALFFGAAAAFGEVLLCRIGSGLFSVGLFYSLYRFLNVAAFSSMPAAATGTECLEFYRRQLILRRDTRSGYWAWGVLPTLPGALLATLGWIAAEPQAWYLAVGILAFFLGMQYVALQHHDQKAVVFQKEIDLLDGHGELSTAKRRTQTSPPQN